ncbi:hypothetical protein ZWY2020_041049 [Hordeum vulgare]|nr:hypothetical protein ZWY2020_041049 [Hordeum vulgare]
MQDMPISKPLSCSPPLCVTLSKNCSPNNHTVAGCCMQGRMSRRGIRTICVGNLPWDISEREVEDLFYKVCIPIPVPLYTFLLTLKVGGCKARVTWSDPMATETTEVPDTAAHPFDHKLVSRQRLVKEQAAIDKEKSRREQQF